MPDIEEYLNDLSRRLDLPSDRVEAILAEVRLHLESEKVRLMAGLDEAEATRLAIQRFGPPARIAARLYKIHSPPKPYIFRAAAAAVLAWWGFWAASLLSFGIPESWRYWAPGVPLSITVLAFAPIAFLAARIAGWRRLRGKVAVSIAAILAAAEMVAFSVRLAAMLMQTEEGRGIATSILCLAAASVVIVLGAWLLDYLRLHRLLPTDDDMTGQAAT